MKIRPVTLAIVLWLFGLAGAACARFGELTPKAQRAVDTFECRVKAVEPYVGSVLDAEELVRDVIAGRGDLERAFAVLGVPLEDFEAAVKTWNACKPAPEAPEGMPPGVVPVRIVAPPPAYGNRVL